MPTSFSHFSKNGIGTGSSLLVVQYVLFTLFYAYSNPELWTDEIPHKYILYMNLLIGCGIAFAVSINKKLQKEIGSHQSNFPEFKMMLAWSVAFSVFTYGTYLIYNIL